MRADMLVQGLLSDCFVDPSGMTEEQCCDIVEVCIFKLWLKWEETRGRCPLGRPTRIGSMSRHLALLPWRGTVAEGGGFSKQQLSKRVSSYSSRPSY